MDLMTLSSALPFPAPSSFPINLLPVDLLPLVFVHIAVRPLVHVISLVCKRWKRAACLAVRSLGHSDLWNAIPHEVLVTYTSIDRAYYVERKWSAEILAFLKERIRSLELLPYWLFLALDMSLLTNITSLKIGAYMQADRDVLDCLALSLTDLDLEIKVFAGLFRIPYMPALVSLRLTSRLSTPQLESHLQLSILTSFHINISTHTLKLILPSQTPPLPLLRSLSLGVPLRETARLISWANRCPALTSLSLHTTIHMRIIEQLERKSILTVVHLEPDGDLASAQERLLLAECTGLRQYLGPVNTYPLLGEQLIRMDLPWSAMTTSGFAESAMRHCTSLTELRLGQNGEAQGAVREAAFAVAMSLFAWRLPLLQRLTWRYEAPEVSDAAAVVSSAICAWPTLKYASLEVFNPRKHARLDEKSAALLNHALAIADRNAAVEIDLGAIQPLLAQNLQALSVKYKWISLRAGSHFDLFD